MKIFKNFYDQCEKMIDDGWSEGWDEGQIRGYIKFCIGGLLEGVLTGCFIIGAVDAVISLVKLMKISSK